MAESLSSIKFLLRMLCNVQNDVDGKTATAAMGADFTPATSLSSGTAANKADRFWQDEGRTLTSGNSETIDLYDLGTLNIGAGAGKDPMGQAWAAAEIVGLVILVSAASTGTLLVGGDGTTAAWNSIFNGDDDAILPVLPGGAFSVFAPTDPAYAVADTTNHLLQLEASGGDVTYSIYVLARSA